MYQKIKDYINYIKKNPDQKKHVTTLLSVVYAFIAWNTIGLGIYQLRGIAKREKREIECANAGLMSSLQKEGDHILRYKGFKKIEEYAIKDGAKVQIYRSPKLGENTNKDKELLSEGNDDIIVED